MGRQRAGGALRAGTDARELPAPLGVPMMGYGAREGVARGRLEPLQARALYLADGSSDLLLIEADLCLIAPGQAAAVRTQLAERTGVPAERICVACIHTHAGPDTGLGALLAGAAPPPHVAPLLDTLVAAGVAAHAAAAPARLGVGHARAAIGRNRRAADGPLDPDVLVVRIDASGAAPLALLYVHGCHPTALGHENLDYAADWPGAAAREIAEAFPGVNPIFGLGAHADVDPRTRGLLDLAIAGQSVGVSPAETEALGRELGRAVAAAAARIETDAGARVGAASTRLRIPAHPGAADDAAAEIALEPLRAAALGALGFAAEPDPPLRTRDFFRLERERTRELPAAERRDRIARVRRYLRDHTAPRFAGGREPEVEAQVLHLGPARLLALPLEATVDVGLEWKRRLGSEHAAVLSIANGWLRYLPHPRHFVAPDAHQKYEVLQSTFVPDAALRLLDAGVRLDAHLRGSPGGAGGRAEAAA